MLRLMLCAALVAAAAVCAGCAGGQQAAGVDPALAAQAHLGRALATKAAGNLTGAADELALAVKTDPNNYFAWYQLGQTYRELGQDPKARLAWQQGLAAAVAGPDRADYPRLRAEAQMRAGLAGLEAAAQKPEPAPPAAVPPPAAKTGWSAPGAPAKPPSPPAAKAGAAAQPAPPVAKAKSPAARPKPPTATAAATGGYAVLYSSNHQASSARADQKMLAAKGVQAELVSALDKRGRTWHRVLVTCPGGRGECAELAGKLARQTGRKGLTVIKVSP